MAHGDVTFLKTLSKASLIVINDWGYCADGADLLENLDDRFGCWLTHVRSKLLLAPGKPGSAVRVPVSAGSPESWNRAEALAKGCASVYGRQSA